MSAKAFVNVAAFVDAFSMKYAEKKYAKRQTLELHHNKEKHHKNGNAAKPSEQDKGGKGADSCAISN